MTLDPLRVPTQIAPLLGVAERWGIVDDFERELALRSASKAELQTLVTCLDTIDKDTLSDWLCGSESYATKPSDEYIAITCLTMAIESAKLRVRKDE